MIPPLHLKATDEDEEHSEQCYQTATKNKTKQKRKQKAKAETLHMGHLYANVQH